MKQPLRSFAVFCISLSISWFNATHAGDGLRDVQQRGVLRWGADEEGGGPFVFPSPSDASQRIGFEVDIAELIAKHIGVRAQFTQGQWDKLPDLLNRGDIDIVLNGYEWSPERADRFGLSVPYYIYQLQLLGRPDNPDLQSWGDLQDASVGRRFRVSVLGGSAAHDYLMERAPNVDVVMFDGATDAMRATELAVDGIDANLQDLPVWTFFNSGFPKLSPIGEPVGRGFYIAMTRKDESELLQAMNAAIMQSLHDGSMRRVLSKYNLWNEEQAQRALEVNAVGEFQADTSIPVDSLNGATTESYLPVRGWTAIAQRGGLLVQAAGMTIALSVTAMPLAVLAGLSLAIVRMYGPRALRWLATVYIELVRGTPLVLQLYVIFFLLPEIGISIHAFWAAVLGLAINYSAYEAEIYRAGLQAIPRGQMEAAVSLGMSRNLAVRRVIVPQASRLVIPPVTNDFIALFKDTAVCSVITVVEVSKAYYIQARSTGAIVELGILTAILYLAMSYPLSLLARRLELRLNRDQQT